MEVIYVALLRNGILYFSFEFPQILYLNSEIKMSQYVSIHLHPLTDYTIPHKAISRMRDSPTVPDGSVML